MGNDSNYYSPEEWWRKAAENWINQNIAFHVRIHPIHIRRCPKTCPFLRGTKCIASKCVQHRPMIKEPIKEGEKPREK